MQCQQEQKVAAVIDIDAQYKYAEALSELALS